MCCLRMVGHSMQSCHVPTSEEVPLLQRYEGEFESASIAKAHIHAQEQLSKTLRGITRGSELIERRKAEARSRHRTASIRGKRLIQQTLSILRNGQYAADQESKLKILYELAAVGAREEFRRMIHEVSRGSVHYTGEQMARRCPYETAHINWERHRHLNEALMKGEENAKEQQNELSVLFTKARFRAEELVRRECDAWPWMYIAAKCAHEQECRAFAYNTSEVAREVEYSLLQSTSEDVGLRRRPDEYVLLNLQERA